MNLPTKHQISVIGIQPRSNVVRSQSTATPCLAMDKNSGVYAFVSPKRRSSFPSLGLDAEKSIKVQKKHRIFMSGSRRTNEAMNKPVEIIPENQTNGIQNHAFDSSTEDEPVSSIYMNDSTDSEIETDHCESQSNPTENIPYLSLEKDITGVLQPCFSDLEERVDPTLPPVEVIEDVATAPQPQISLPIIDDLVREPAAMAKEKLRALVIQIFVPFMIAGFGMVAAGVLLDKVQDLPVFQDLSEIFIMVPALLGLKGNLEMTLASRLSTQVNIGGFEDSRRKWRIIGCNVALNQVLASGVGILAAIVAVIFYVIHHGTGIAGRNVLLLFAAAMVSACATSVVQDSVMISIVLFAKRFNINPDNIATPVAGTIGDILTLGILIAFTLLYWSAFKTSHWMVGPSITISIIVLLMPMWIFLASKEPTTRHVLLHGWLPVIMAMIISSCSGVILQQVMDSGLGYFKGLPIFQPLINGVGGNIVSVQASRIATFLHLAYSTPGRVPSGYRYCRTPCHTFCSSSNINARTARLLILMVVPGHLVFLFVISFVEGSTGISLRFAFVFLIMALVQVSILLYVADILTHFVWKKALDPDSTTIPYVTATGDLLGTGLLALGFYLLHICGGQAMEQHNDGGATYSSAANGTTSLGSL